MTPDEIRAAYGRLLGDAGDRIFIRRYTGAGSARPYFDFGPLRAKIRGLQPQELAPGSGIEQGDRSVTLFASDLAAEQFPLPLRRTDRIILDGKELTIQALPDDGTLSFGGTLIAYQLMVRG